MNLKDIWLKIEDFLLGTHRVKLREIEEIEITLSKYNRIFPALPYDYAKLVANKIEKLHGERPIPKEVIDDIIENRPLLFKYWMNDDSFKYLCIDRETFQKITFLAAQCDCERPYELIGLACFYVRSFKVCSEDAIKSAGFYKQFLRPDDVVAILNNHDVPADFEPAVELISYYKHKAATGTVIGAWIPSYLRPRLMRFSRQSSINKRNQKLFDELNKAYHECAKLFGEIGTETKKW